MRTTLPLKGSVEFDLGAGELGMLAAAGFLGGALAGLFLYVFSRLAMLLLGGVVGMASVPGGWIVALLSGIVLALPFGVVVTSSINQFVDRVVVLSSQSDALQTVLVPLLSRSALGVTTCALGTLYGAVVGLVVYLLLVPIWLWTLGGVTIGVATLVVVSVVGTLAYTLYGAVLGLVYGLVQEA